MDIRVIIFEDNKLMREGYQAILNGTEGFICTGAFADTADLDHKMQKTDPDVVLMDIEMPGMDGISSASVIARKWPSVRILMETVFDDDDKIFAAICAGASGYILKSTPPAQLIAAVNEVYNGGAPMSPVIASRVLQLFQKFAPQKTNIISEEHGLSNREQEILARMVEGHSFRSIAEKNAISYETVRTHVKKIYKKLHVASATEAVIKAIRQGLV